MLTFSMLSLTLLHSERPKLYIILAFLSAKGLNSINSLKCQNENTPMIFCHLFTEKDISNDFLFAFLGNKTFPVNGLLFKERIYS